MKKYTILFLLFFAVNNICQSQEIYDKMADKICKCLKNEDLKNQEDVMPCFEKVFVKYHSEFLEYHGVGAISEIDFDQESSIIMIRLLKNCEKVYEAAIASFKDTLTLPTFTKDKNIDCSDLRSGNFYYVEYNQEGKLTDTTFVTITENEYLERLEGGKTYSKLSLEWKKDCTMKLTFIESNNKWKKTLSHPGEVYVYKVIKNSENSMVLEASVHNQVFQVEFIKIKEAPQFPN